MSQNAYFHRTRLLEWLKEKNISHDAQEILMCSFQDVHPDKKETVAQRMYSLIENCETDDDVIRTVYSVIEGVDACDRVGNIPCKQRHKLVKVLEEKAFSSVVKQNIVRRLLESPCETEREVESLANKCIALVQKCQTETELIYAIQKLIEQEFDDRCKV